MSAAVVSIVVLGAGGHAKVVVDLLLSLPAFRVIGLVDPAPSATGFFGVPLLGDDTVLPKLRREGVTAAVVAVGDNAARARLGMLVRLNGFDLPSLVHPTATVSRHALLEEGVVVMAGAGVGPDARLGPFAVVNTRSVVEHDCVVDEAAHVAPMAALGGSVKIGARSLIGIGAAVRPGARIGSDVVVGAGASVVSDLPDGTIAIGVPARPTLHGTQLGGAA